MEVSWEGEGRSRWDSLPSGALMALMVEGAASLLLLLGVVVVVLTREQISTRRQEEKIDSHVRHVFSLVSLSLPTRHTPVLLTGRRCPSLPSEELLNECSNLSACVSLLCEGLEEVAQLGLIRVRRHVLYHHLVRHT